MLSIVCIHDLLLESYLYSRVGGRYGARTAAGMRRVGALMHERRALDSMAAAAVFWY